MTGTVRGFQDGARGGAARKELTRPLRRESLLNAPRRAPPASVRLRASRLSRSARDIFDEDGTGEISTAAVASVARRVQATERTAAALRRRLWLALIAAVLLAASVLGLVVWGAELVKETIVVSGGGDGGGDDGGSSSGDRQGRS